MRCRKAEKLILQALDRRLEPREERALQEHLSSCVACRRAREEYGTMLGWLRNGRTEEPLPRFWERLEPRLREESELVPLLFWERLSLRAIPVFLALVVLAGAAFLLTPGPAADLSHSEALLLENRGPLAETREMLEAERPETANMMLLFASFDARGPARRPMP